MHTLLKELRERGSLTRAAGTHVAIAELDKLDWGYQHSEPCPMCTCLCLIPTQGGECGSLPLPLPLSLSLSYACPCPSYMLFP